MKRRGVPQASPGSTHEEPREVSRRLTSRQLTMIAIGGAIGTGLS
jgi:amino acid permease